MGLGGSALTGMDESIAIQREGLQRMRDFLGASPFESDALPRRSPQEEATITFSNPAAEQFLVDGTKIPDGESPRREFNFFFFY